MKFQNILRKLKNQFMKNENSIWLFVIVFLVGSLISYSFCQYYYLQIDPKVNVVQSLISITTAIIGLYLAISLKKIQTKSSNLHNYLQPKLDFAWKLFLTLSHQLSLQDQLEISELTKSIKEITQNITPLKKMFSSFGLTDPCMDNLETQIENLEKFLVDDCEVSENIINYLNKKEKLRDKLDNVHTQFVNALKVINKIS